MLFNANQNRTISLWEDARSRGEIALTGQLLAALEVVATASFC